MGPLDVLLSNPISLAIPFCLFYAGWVASHRPHSNDEPKETYIKDANVRKVEIHSCKLDWGTRYFPFRFLKVLDVPVKSSVQIWYTPQGGTESLLEEKYYEHNPVGNKVAKPVRLKERGFFRNNFITTVHAVVETPFERSLYEGNVKHKIDNDKFLKIWNENAEEIRGFRFLVTRPVKLDAFRVVAGQIAGIEMTMPYSAFDSYRSKQFASLGADVTISLILNLSGRKHDVLDEIVVQIAN